MEMKAEIYKPSCAKYSSKPPGEQSLSVLRRNQSLDFRSLELHNKLLLCKLPYQQPSKFIRYLIQNKRQRIMTLLCLFSIQFIIFFSLQLVSYVQLHSKHYFFFLRKLSFSLLQYFAFSSGKWFKIYFPCHRVGYVFRSK